MQFHIIAITLRRAPGQGGYRRRASFDAATLLEAHATHAAYPRNLARWHVLRDGATGRRYSLAESQDAIALAKASQVSEINEQLETYYDERMRLARAA